MEEREDGNYLPLRSRMERKEPGAPAPRPEGGPKSQSLWARRLGVTEQQAGPSGHAAPKMWMLGTPD